MNRSCLASGRMLMQGNEHAVSAMRQYPPSQVRPRVVLWGMDALEGLIVAGPMISLWD